mgnify:CR=1 FL=1
MRRSRLMATHTRLSSAFTRALLSIMLALLIAVPFAPFMPAIGFAPHPIAADPCTGSAPMNQQRMKAWWQRQPHGGNAIVPVAWTPPPVISLVCAILEEKK